MSMEGDRAEVARIVIGHANSIGIHTGNILNWTMLKKHRFHSSMTSADEVRILFILTAATMMDPSFIFPNLIDRIFMNQNILV